MEAKEEEEEEEEEDNEEDCRREVGGSKGVGGRVGEKGGGRKSEGQG